MRKEQEIGLIVSSFRVPADELVDQYLITWSDFIRSAFLLFTLMNSGGSPLLWLFFIFYLSRSSLSASWVVLTDMFSPSDERSYYSEKVALCDCHVKTAACFSSARFCWAVMSLALKSKIIFGCKEWFIRITAVSKYIILLVLWLIKQD